MKNCRPPAREVRVQFYALLTEQMTERLLLPVCAACEDVVIGAPLNRRGLCPCCAQRARLEKSA